MSEQTWQPATERVSMRLPARHYKRLEALALRKAVPVAVLARMLLLEALERAETAQEGGNG